VAALSEDIAPIAVGPWRSVPRRLQTLACKSWAQQPDLPMSRLKEALAACPVQAMRIRHIELDPDGKPIVTMSTGRCPLYFLAGASLTTGSAVEFGTWAGSSTRCIAAGVNFTGGPDGRVFGFDMFRPGWSKPNMKKMLDQVSGTRFERDVKKQTYKFDMTRLFMFYTGSVYPSVKAVRADFDVDSAHKLQSGFRRQQLDLWSTDAAKGWEKTLKQVEIVRPFLNVGAIIVFADFMHRDTCAFVYSIWVPEYLELLTFFPGGAEFFFGLKKTLRAMPVQEGKLFMNQKDANHWRQVRDRIKADMARVYRPGLSELEMAFNISVANALVDDTFASLR